MIPFRPADRIPVLRRFSSTSPYDDMRVGLRFTSRYRTALFATKANIAMDSWQKEEMWAFLDPLVVQYPP